MDQTEKLAEAIYTAVCDRLLESIIKNLQPNESTESEIYRLIESIFSNLDDHQKKLFINYIQIILNDCTTTILAGLDGVTDIGLYPCEDIEILCDGEKIKPWIHEIFVAIYQEKTPNLY